LTFDFEFFEHPELTDRQNEFARLLLQGLSNKEIASRMGIVERTAKSYMATVALKLGIRKADTVKKIKRIVLAVKLYEWCREQANAINREPSVDNHSSDGTLH